LSQSPADTARTFGPKFVTSYLFIELFIQLATAAIYYMRSIALACEIRETHALILRAGHKARRAFSMIELVIVILIMSIFSAVAAPKFLDSLLFHHVESAVRRVKADIDYARQRARLTSTTQTVTFTGSTYTVSGMKSLDLNSSTYTVNLTRTPYSLDSATANFGGSQVLTFDGYGTPTSGGTVVLTAKAHHCTITVDGVTGNTTFTSSHPGGGSAVEPGS
jgi:prepilin-type N-terminal cleavage/methylation domain-containing protein